MSNGLATNSPKGTARIITIICMGMISGLAMFTGIAISMSWGQLPEASMILSIISVVMMAVAAIASSVIPSMILPQILQGIRQSDGVSSAEDLLLKGYMTTMIIRLAILEAPGFVGDVAFIVEHQMWSLAIPLASIVLILIQIPTASRIEDWLKFQKENLT